MYEAELQRILDYIRSFTERHGFPPSYAEIAEGCGLGSVGHVQYRVNRLIGQGRLVRSPGRARSLQVVDHAAAAASATPGRKQTRKKSTHARLGSLFATLRRNRRVS
jgi:repressor LexA